MTKHGMLKEMGQELNQADLKAIGQSRGFDKETIASRELLQHVFLSEQGVVAALASLTEAEWLGLHLLNSVRAEVELDFFKRVYPGLVPTDYYRTYTERHKGLFQHVKNQLVRRGVLLFGTVPKGYEISEKPMLERVRFLFPDEFAPFLPQPFQPRTLAASVLGQYRKEVLREKLAEIVQLDHAPAGDSTRSKVGHWQVTQGELLFDGEPYRVSRLEAWRLAQFQAAVGHTVEAKAEALQPIPLLRYALSRLKENEWLAPADLLPLWKMALSKTKTPEPQEVCAAGYQWGYFEKVEQDDAVLYRLPRGTDIESDSPPETFLNVQNPQHIKIDLATVPLETLERLGQISHLEIVHGELNAAPKLLKTSHAPAETLADPAVAWLRQHHPAYRTTLGTVEKKRGRLIVHENLLVARVNDLGLKVTLEKKFGQPGQWVALSDQYVAFPKGLLPEIQSHLKKSGHVIKSHSSPKSH